MTKLHLQLLTLFVYFVIKGDSIYIQVVQQKISNSSHI